MTYSSGTAGVLSGLSSPSSSGCGVLSGVEGRGAGVTWSLLTLRYSPFTSMTKVESSASGTTNGPTVLLCSLFCCWCLVV